MYALKENTSGLYLDIQTSGIHEPGQTTNSMSLNAKPCVIYFEAGEGGKWKMKNACGTYASNITDGRDWNTSISSTAYEWTISAEDGDIAKLTLSKDGSNYVGWDKVNEITAGSALYNNAEVGNTKAKRLYFTLVEEYPINTHCYYALKCGEFYLSMTASGNTAYSLQLQKNASYFYLVPSANAYFLENKDDRGKYVGTDGKDNRWDAGTGFALWNLTQADNAYTIARFADSDKCFGTDEEPTENRGLYTNVGSSGVKKWTIEETNIYTSSVPTFDDKDLTVLKDNSQYLTALSLNGTAIFSNLVAPAAKADMYVVAEDKGIVLEPGGEYTFTTTFPNNKTSHILAANLWIDKDGNGVYETHLGTTGTANSNSNNLSTVTFTVPDDATTGFTRIRFRLDSSWGIAETANANANRMIYDIPVHIAAPRPKVNVTYQYYYNDKKVGEETLKAFVGMTFPGPRSIFKMSSDLLAFDLPTGEVTVAGTHRVNVSIAAAGFPIATSIAEGDFADDTQWYFTTLRGKNLKFEGGTEIVASVKRGIGDGDLFAVTGDIKDGFLLYNKALGTSKTIYSNSPDNLNSVVPLNNNPNGTWSVTANTNGAFSFYVANQANYYLHEKEGRLKFWNSESSKSDAGSNLVFTPAYEYTILVEGLPQEKTTDITYGGIPVVNNKMFAIDNINLNEFLATDIAGYAWSISRSGRTINISYEQPTPEVNPEPVVSLIKRIGGEDVADKFKFVLDATMMSRQREVFMLGSEDDKILIKGSTISAITTGIGWYLNNVAHINIAWNSLNEKTVAVKEKGAAYADLSNLPLPSQTETHISDAKYRYYLNTCTFGYSMTSWTWTRWQQEIDWMALHGINMPLQLVGLEEVWRIFLIKCGYSESDAKAFVAGPAFIAWWAMNNLEGWGGTAAGSKSGYDNLAGAGGVQDDAWYARQKKLAKQIVEAQRGLGMQPVIPGWSGMVPTNFASKSAGKYATRGNGGNWAGDFVRPLLLSVSNANYAEIAADYYECLHAVMGESQYYSMDPFHEGGGAGTMEDYEALYAAMEAAKPGSQWVIQQWQWSATQKYSLSAVPAGRLIVLDLFSDGSPAFDSYNGYAPQEAVFCAIPNFGGRSGLMGRLQNLTDNYFKFKGKYASIKGIGAAPEAIEQTPVTYDLIFQLPWMNGEKPIVEEWVNNYSIARYGKDNKIVKEAWSLLRQGPLNYGADGIQGPVEDVWAARPNLNANAASFWGKTLNNGTASNTYTKERRQMLIDAVYKLIDQEDELALTAGSVYESNYLYDLVEFGGAVMADYAYDLLIGIRDAKNAANTALYEARRDAFLQLILDMDAFRGTNLNFRLGKWTQEARAAAAEVEGASTATPDWYEYNNARTILSTWSSPGTNLTDYSYRSWQGLLKDYYYPRWEHFFNNNCTAGDYKFFEWNWAHGMKYSTSDKGISTTPLTSEDEGHTSKYTREPVGNTVEKAVEMLGKYIIPIAMDNGTTYYAYRTFTTDLAGKATVRVAAGGNVDFTKLFNIPDDAEVSGTVVKGDSPAQANAVPVEDAEGNYTATITLADGTVLSNITVVLVAMNEFEGVYTIALHHGNTSYDTYIANNGGRYELTAGQNVSPADADKMFTIVPSSVGYTFSAQGQYLKTPKANSLTFSNSEDEMGAYIIEKLDGDNEYKLRTSNKYLNADEDFLFASSNDASTFTITKAETFPLTVTAAGMATLCLPFNVVLPQGMVAYDLVEEKIVKEDSKAYAYMQVIAEEGAVLKAGTPVIVKAYPGDYDLGITMSNENAVSSLANSLLKGNFVSQTLTQGTDVKKFIFANGSNGVGFYIMDAEGTIGANKCWMEWAMPADANVRSLVIRFADTTDIENVEVAPERPAQQGIYNLAGQRLEAPQKGINIINGRKVIVK